MAKKQTFGEKALASKQAQQKMAKVIISEKNSKGTYSYRETVIAADSVDQYIAKNKG